MGLEMPHGRCEVRTLRDNTSSEDLRLTSDLAVTRNQMLNFLRSRGIQQLFGEDGGGNALFGVDDDDDEYDPRGQRRRRRGVRPTDPFPKVPSDEGRALMESGIFGTNERQAATYKRRTKLGNRMMKRELGLTSPGKERSANRLAAQVRGIRFMKRPELTKV